MKCRILHYGNLCYLYGIDAISVIKWAIPDNARDNNVRMDSFLGKNDYLCNGNGCLPTDYTRADSLPHGHRETILQTSHTQIRSIKKGNNNLHA